jgi:hypothetical protein
MCQIRPRYHNGTLINWNWVTKIKTENKTNQLWLNIVYFNDELYDVYINHNSSNDGQHYKDMNTKHK